MSFNLEQHAGLNISIPAGATAGAALTGLSGAVRTYSISATNQCIDGVWSANAAVSGGNAPTTDARTGLPIRLVANQAVAIVWVVNAAGNEGVLAGQVVTNAAGASCPLPEVPAGWLPIAVHTLAAGPTLSGTWEFGNASTGLWNAAGLTVGTVQNLAGQLPARPPSV